MALTNLFPKLKAAAKSKLVFSSQTDLGHKVYSRLKSLSAESVYFLDVGANVGQSTIPYSKLKLENGRINLVVHSFEPFIENFEKLSRDTKNITNIHVHNVGMGSFSQVIEVPLAANPEWHSISNQERWRESGRGVEKIIVLTLDEFVEEQSINGPIILKTDTEGFDLEVLRGANRLLSLGMIEIVICEVGFNKEDNQHSFFIDVFNYLSGFGYRLCEIQDQVAYKHPDWGGALSIGYANAWFVSPVRVQKLRL